MENSDLKKIWENIFKELARLVKKDLINDSDIEAYMAKLFSISVGYDMRRENNPHKLLNTFHKKLEISKLNKVLLLSEKLINELKECDYLWDKNIEPLYESLNKFIHSQSDVKLIDSKVGKGKKVKLSKHELFRTFELLFYAFNKRAKINDLNKVDFSDTYKLADEFMLAAGYIPESSKKTQFGIRKQNFDEAREVLKEKGISDKDLFYYYMTFD